MAPPRSPTASRSPHKKAPGKRARSAAPPDPAPPTTRSTKRARLTAEDVELEDEEIEEAFDDVPADDQSGVPGEWSPRTQRAGGFVDPEVCVSCALSGQVCTFTASSRSTSCAPCILSHSRCHKAPRKTWKTLNKYRVFSQFAKGNSAKLLQVVEPIRADLEKRKDLPRHTDLASWPNARSPATGYETEWSEYEAEVDEIEAHPSAAVVLAERTAVAAEEAVVQIKTLLTVNSTLLARFTHFEADLRTRLEIPPAAGHEDFVRMLVKDVTDAAAGDKDNGGGGGSAEGGA
ncbi:hypothetical protein EKO04_004399 [Ascochyta lentis]|uniref:Uncharacterized protein n=1 Tax=Ascochyta lentis TaxID=205686 RepID=A0A8H7J3H7_9PLEO|nr:hypothetical protein EKO04_006150 [Ascochyta lentis]KAF9697500.1 hypothetical protein EKO04_004399 [Ascochyta lentis]